MSRYGIPRAYLRFDPNIDQVYPELRSTFVGLCCAAHRQPHRGRFRNRQLVESLCGRAYARRAFERGDVVELPDGSCYVPGWDEWQEGDFTVAERMRRVRDRRRRERDSVTPVASPDSNAVTTDASSEVNGVLDGVGVGVTPQPPTRGGRRSDGTNQRAVAAALTRKAEEEERARKERRVARQRAYLDGRLTEAQRDEMNDRDAPLEDIPTKRGAAYQQVPA